MQGKGRESVAAGFLYVSDTAQSFYEGAFTRLVEMELKMFTLFLSFQKYNLINHFEVPRGH